MSLLKKIFNKKNIVIFSIPFLLGGCQYFSPEDEDTPETPQSVEDTTTDTETIEIIRGGTVGEVVLGNNTINLDKSYIKSYDSDTGKIVVDPSVASRLRKGDILLVPEKGIWKKIKSKSSNSYFYNSSDRSITGGTTVYTSNSTLEETFKNIDIDETFNVSQNIPVELIVYDRDNNDWTTENQVKVNGDIFLSGNMNVWLNITNSLVTKLGLSNNLTLNSILDLEIGSELKNKAIVKEKCLQKNLTPILVPPLPAIPLVEITPVITFCAGFKGKLGFELTTYPGMTYDAEVFAKISYDKFYGGWQTEKDFDNEFNLTLPNIGKINTNLKTYLSTQLTAKFYHFAGPFARVKGGLEFNLDTDADPYWTLGPYVEGDVGVKAKLFNFLNAEKKINVFNYDSIWNQSEGGIEVPEEEIPDEEEGLGGEILFSARESSNDDFDIYKINPDGTGLTTLARSSEWEIVSSWAPDKSKVYYHSKIAFVSDDFEIYSMNPDGSDKNILVSNSKSPHSAVVSPDGEKLAYLAGSASTTQIYLTDLDNLTDPTNISDNFSYHHWDLHWPISMDNTLFFSSDKDGDSEIYSMRDDGSDLTRITNNTAYDRNPVVSPDGKFLAFDSNRSEDRDVWIMELETSELTNITNNSSATDEQPSWSPDSKYLVYTSGNYSQELWIANIDTLEKWQIPNAEYDNACPKWSP